MKKSIFFLTVMLIAFCAGSVKGQTLSLDVNNMNSATPDCTGDIQFVVYALDVNTCTQVGESQPISFPTQGNSFRWTYSNISSGPGWVTDPGPACGPPNNWFFGGIKIMNCGPSIGSGSINCTNGNYDGVILYDNCGGSPSQCFEYSLNCSNCNAGTVLSFAFGDGGPYCTGTAVLTFN